MSLARRCSNSFDPFVRTRGRLCYFQKLVDVGADACGVTALVEGSGAKPYEVNLEWDSAVTGTLSANCTCPYFQNGALCKHIWATILAVDSEGLSREIPGNRALQVVLARHPNAANPVAVAATRRPAHRAGGVRPHSGSPSRGVVARHHAAWQTLLDQVGTQITDLADQQSESEARPDTLRQEAFYVLNIGASLQAGGLLIELFQRQTLEDRSFGGIRPLMLGRHQIDYFTDPADRILLQLMLSDQALESRLPHSSGYHASSYRHSYGGMREIFVSPSLYEVLLPRLCATGRFVWVLENEQPPEDGRTLAWEDAPAWKFRLHVAADDARQVWRISGQLYREQQIVLLRDAVLLLAHGVVVFPDRLARLDVAEEFPWIALLRRQDTIEVPYSDRNELLENLWRLPRLPDLELPENLQLEPVRIEPRGRLSVLPPQAFVNSQQLCAKVSFIYDTSITEARRVERGLVDHENQTVLLRDPAKEMRLLTDLVELGIDPVEPYYADRADVEFPRRLLPEFVSKLTGDGWVVEAEGRQIRRPGQFHLSVTSQVDWFELEGKVDFDGVAASLPALLAALHRGERYVRLDDGSQGMLPEDWLTRYGAFAELGKADGDTLRFAPSQAALLDALLAAQENVDVDAHFDDLRKRLRSFDGVKPCPEPPGFSGSLRGYQQDGLGWLNFLQEFRFGGCLADDMGLGKTIQVLALLESRRGANAKSCKKSGPSLVVVPRSLIFNWIEEAARFTPELRVLNYTGTGRAEYLDQLDRYDLLLTTYGTLRRDVMKLKELRFDYAILDESQAIKNPQSQSAKACRLLSANHRLAMTGTPVENHLGELWSLFEFLNPGMLGRSSAFSTLVKAANGNTATDNSAAKRNGQRNSAPGEDPAVVAMLAQSLRPFILRRTKQQVLTELPEKSEQTLYCEMDKKQRQLYDELRDYYRIQLTERVKKSGIKKSKIHVLEALLRLRQAACHPGLLDKKKAGEPSAKLETLLEQVTEIIAEGHKALIFSQFTSLLSIVRQRLVTQRVPYEYLDGRTRNRQEKVHRFQNDVSCPLFLISLKAGGQGLNLTAADYVFILDPWWNPAVEAQAVDRAHRIGQTRRVFAYRLICRDTVEEKIIELQRSKRELADAIVSADNSLIRSLTAEDLQLLLS